MLMATRNTMILLSFITIITRVCIVLSFNNFTIEVNEIPQNIIENCIIDILTSKTQFKSIVTVINTDAVSNRFLQQIHSINNVNICIKDVNASIKVVPTIYLIHVNDGIEFEDLLDDLDRDWNREPEALFIVIVKSNPEDYKECVAAVFRSLWEYHLIHVLVIVKYMDNDASVYTYFPYAEGRCGRDYSTLVQLCDCSSVGEVDVVGKLREYDTPVLDNCTLDVAIRHYPPLVFCSPVTKNLNIGADKLNVGVERFLIELLFERRNISLNYTCLLETENAGYISDNFTFSGIVGKLYENEFDLIFGGLSLNTRRVKFFDYLCFHLAYEDMYVTVTHTTSLIERWKIVYLMFHANVWILLLFIMVFCAVLLTDFGNFWIIQARHTIMTEFLNLFGHATQNINLVMRKKLFKNVLIICWMWFIFFINCFYQTRLLSFTIYPFHKPQLDQYLSLYDYNLTPCIPIDIVSFLKNAGNVVIINDERMDTSNCKTAEMALDEVAKNKNKYTVAMYFQYLWWLRNNLKQKERVHLMKESVYSNIYGLFFKRGFPLLESLNSLMLRLPEHGFVQGFMDLLGFPRHSRQQPAARASFEVPKTPLKLKDFPIAFGILATGIAFSFMAFIKEITHKRKLGGRRNGFRSFLM
ncbi:uncharacterized protein LOC134741841 [Cydia strobilella]|uniref:uncharacterized protein LOC134741841 n=1 Tax=Cydia strobilella TaxID=1100964 RepID=UPI0030041EF0